MRLIQAGLRTALLGAMMLMTLISVSSAATPTALNFQGRLTTAAGTTVTDGSYSVVFTVYDAASGGTSNWTETQLINTTSGLFAVLLGAVTPITDSVFNGSTRYLGIKVGTDPELTPRTRLATAPYAFRINTVDGATGGAISGNINLDASTATTGNVYKGGTLFLHNYGAANTFVGQNAGNLTLTGNQNAANGAGALHSNTAGSGNTASGAGALFSNTTGGANTACGFDALGLNSTGTNNTAAGNNALQNNTTGSFNTASGFDALYTDTTGNNNTANGSDALYFNTSGTDNTASGVGALQNNSTGMGNSAIGYMSLVSNITGSDNTAIGYGADVFTGALINATAIGANAHVNASNKIRLGDPNVTIIEGQVAYTFTSDRNQKENFQPVDGDDVLRKISGLSLTSWNYKKQDPSKFRHYGPVAQEFFAAFGHDAIGQCGDSTSINSGDETGILMVAVQTLEREKEQLKAKNAELETRLEKVELALSKLADLVPAANKELVAK